MAQNNKIILGVSAKSLGFVKNRTYNWLDFCEYLSVPYVDTINSQEYANLDETTKLEAKKKAGYYVGGPSEDGRRKTSSIKQRSLLCYDFDKLTKAEYAIITKSLTKLSDFEYFWHTTRSHAPEKPRLRVVFPLKNPVKAQDFQALSRFVASQLLSSVESSMEAVDSCSFRIAQLMYFPTLNSDSQFFSGHNKGDFIDPYSYLDTIKDWSNPEKWPRSKKNSLIHGLKGNTIQNPSEKEGVIGFFCREYDIEEAINEFLPEIYCPSDISSTEIRYTYHLGSSKGGAVVYDDGQYLYSHHDTDPVCGKCVNSFDLVRIHLFGDLDLEPEASLSSLESFRAMKELIKDKFPDYEFNDHTVSADDFADIDEEPSKYEEPSEDVEDTNSLDEITYLLKPYLQGSSSYNNVNFPLECLPDYWAGKIKEWAKESNAPMSYVAWSFMALFGSCLGNARHVSPNNSRWSEPPALWVALVGNPSVKKSPAIGIVSNLLTDIIKEWDSNYDEERKGYLAKKKAMESSLKTLTMEEKQQLFESVDKPPVRRVLKVNDPTIEYLVKASSQNPRGLLLIRDELSGWFNSMTRYRSEGSDRPAWLESYSGRYYSTERKKDDGEVLKSYNFLVSMVGGIQPEVLKTMGTNNISDGLLQRFIMCFSEGEDVEKNLHYYAERTDGKDREVEAKLKNILNLSMEINSVNAGKPRVIPFHPEAFKVFNQWHVNKLDEYKKVSNLMVTYLGKAESQVSRIALILEYLKWSEDLKEYDEFWDCSKEEPSFISLDSVSKAIYIYETNIKSNIEILTQGEAVCNTHLIAIKLMQKAAQLGVRDFNTKLFKEMIQKETDKSDKVANIMSFLETTKLIRKVAINGNRYIRINTELIDKLKKY